MIKQVIRLIQPGVFLPCFVADSPRSPSDILIRPRYLSICAADQRYFQGNRPPEVLAKKLPLALFHEALGEVVMDPSGELTRGSLCVLLPGGEHSLKNNSNYAQGAFFRSSNADGFCQEVIYMKREELLPVPSGFPDPSLFVFAELMSVSCQAIRKLQEKTELKQNARVGVWGDGAMAFMTTLALRHLHPSLQIFVYGKHEEKLLNFSFASKKIHASDHKDKSSVDIAFECVGGHGSQLAIENAISRLTPTGTLVLMGVSETAPTIPTRIILEKGLTLTGVSRSTRADFCQALELLSRPLVYHSLHKMVSHRCSFSSASELIDIFTFDKRLPFKTIIEVNL